MYNCNTNERVKIAEDFFRMFNNAKIEVYNNAIHKRKNNTGICGALTWLEIKLIIMMDNNPFNRRLERLSLKPEKPKQTKNKKKTMKTEKPKKTKKN